MLLALLACTAPGADTADTMQADTVSISGLVYAFRTREFLEGATVGLHEHPAMTTVSGPDGTWSFEGLAPGEAVTPWFELDGFRSASHRQFTLEADQERVYFQAVPTAVYDLMFNALVNAGVDIDPDACHVASTVTDPYMNQVSTWEQFDEFIPHGLAGVVLDSPDTIYFNEDVFPQPDLTETTIDGGVIVPNLDVGPHTLVASDGIHTFDQVVVNCEAGRFVNASPPWGLNAH